MNNSEPESWSIKLSSINAARAAIEMGIENTQELLIDWDVRFGRTTRSNRSTAERLEREIEQMQQALAELETPNGESYGLPDLCTTSNPPNPCHTINDAPANETDEFWERCGGNDFIWEARDFCRIMEKQRNEMRHIIYAVSVGAFRPNDAREWLVSNSEKSTP